MNGLRPERGSRLNLSGWLKNGVCLKYRETLTAASKNPAKFRGSGRVTNSILMAPEWGIYRIRNVLIIIGFHTEEVWETPAGEWQEGEAAVRVPKLSDLHLTGQRYVARPTVLTGWEAIKDEAVRTALPDKNCTRSRGNASREFPSAQGGSSFGSSDDDGLEFALNAGCRWLDYLRI